MAHNWKPGDVAVVTYQQNDMHDASEEVRAIRWRHGWITSGERGYEIVHDPAIVTVRSLSIIDRDDRRDVERLAEELYVWGLSIAGAREMSPTDCGDEYRSGMADRVQGALRDVAKPQVPEPTGRYAEVEDAEGRVWYRDPVGTWRRIDAPEAYYSRTWPIKPGAVRVLSEGLS